MKQKLTFLLTVLLLLTGLSLWGQTRTQINWTASEQGYGNGQVIDTVTFDDNVTAFFYKGTNNNPPKYYNTGSAIRCYGGNYFTVSATSGNLTEIALSFATGEGTNAITTDVGTYENDTWTGSASSVTFTIGGTNGHRRIAAFTITYSAGGTPTVATPTFDPQGGAFTEAQTVTISCTTEGATIYYTTDGTNPTENGQQYSIGMSLNISETTTLKAKAFKDGYIASAIAEATYTFLEPITIEEARALANNAYGCVEGTVIFIDGRNVYVQDTTAGIVLYLNSNTVPETLAIGDNVRAYGKRTTFNGLAELTGINGNNTNEFIILSNDNPLPLDVKTVAEINADFAGDNMFQSTRVIIEGAVIGAINTNGNTAITQDGSNLNIYRIPNVDGMIQGDLVTVTGIIGCYNSVQLRVLSADDISYIHRPTLTATPTTLSDMTYAFESGGPSETTYFTLAGNNLTGPAQVFPSESFEVSTMPNFHPENPANVFSQGSFHDINIYVRMKAGLEVGAYNEQVYAVSENADTLFINVSGNVTNETPTPPTPGDGNYVRISELSSLTSGSYVVFAARFDENATDYYAMSNASSGKPTGVLFTSTTDEGNEILPASIVEEEESYYWTVGVTTNGYTFTNANGELIGYASGTNFATGGDNTEWAIDQSTAGDGAMVPNYTGFVISNVNNAIRAFALNSNHNFGPYHTQNMGGSGYNFYLDLFVKTEGGEPPVPTVATPTFTPEGGTYFEEQSLSIACTTDGATIYYSTVSANGPWIIYTSPITISETTSATAAIMHA